MSYSPKRMNRGLLVVIIITILWILVFSAFAVWKYSQFSYNALDLAIYNQVLTNTVDGSPFAFTIHPHSYLGDHVEYILLLITPLFGVLKHPITLLIIQIAVLASGVWPLYRLARRKLDTYWSSTISILYLLSPFLQNAAMFEFHALIFAAPIILWMLYLYRLHRFIPWIVMLALLLVVREDMALIVFMVGIYAITQRRRLRWILTPLIAAPVWFAVAIWTASSFQPSGIYKYFSFWGGSGGFTEMIAGFFSDPFDILLNIFSLQTLTILLFLFVPILFIPLLRPKVLITVLLYISLFFIGDQKSLLSVFNTHYTAPLIPIIFVGFIDSLSALRSSSWRCGWLRAIIRDRTILTMILIASSVYAMVWFGPLLGWFQPTDGAAYSTEWNDVRKVFYKNVDDNSRLTTTYTPITPLSGRKDLTSLNYGFLGHRQLSEASYTLPASDELLIDSRDTIAMYLQFHDHSLEDYAGGDERLLDWMASSSLAPVYALDHLVYFRNDVTIPQRLYSVTYQKDPKKRTAEVITDSLLFSGFHNPATNGNTLTVSQCQGIESQCSVLPAELVFHALDDIDTDYHLRLRFENDDGVAWERLYPVAYGLYPTSNWKAGDTVTLSYWFWVPPIPGGQYDIMLSVVEIDGGFPFSTARAREINITEQIDIGNPIRLGTIILD